MTENTPAIQLAQVSKVFETRGADAIRALDDVNLTVEPQAFVSLIGPSGCGKSTVLRIIGDLIPPTSGAVTILGQTAHQARMNRAYGMVFQTPTLYEWRTVGRNVQLPLELSGVGRAERRAIVAQVLETVELSEFEHHYPWQLSGGMQQRVSIARALTFKPELLLMDEPFGALDEMTRERMNLELLQIHAQTHTTIIFITHSIAEAVFLSTHVAVMSRRPGRITRMIPIDLPHPRTLAMRDSVEFVQLTAQVREALYAEPA